MFKVTVQRFKLCTSQQRQIEFLSLLEIIRQTQQTLKDTEEILQEILSSELLIELVESHLVIGTPGLLDFMTMLTAI